MFEFHPFIAVQFFSALWQICRLYTQKCIVDFFPHFPFISYGRSFLTEDHECDYFFPAHLTSSNHAFNFLLCSHSKCHKSHQVSYHSDEAVIFLNSEVTEEHTRVKYENILTGCGSEAPDCPCKAGIAPLLSKSLCVQPALYSPRFRKQSSVKCAAQTRIFGLYWSGTAL